MTAPKAPAGLDAHGLAFWRKATADRDFAEAHDLERLAIAARALDEIAADEALLRTEGRYTSDRWGRRIPHPALKTVAENRVLFLRCIRELGLDLVVADDSRPRRQY